MLNDKLKTRNMAFLLRQQILSLTTNWTKLIRRILWRSCVCVNISSLILNLKNNTQSIKFCNGKTQRNNSRRETQSLLWQFKVCGQSDFDFRFFFLKNIEEGTFRFHTQTKTLPYWTGWNLCVPKTTFQNQKKIFNKTDVI